MATKLNQLKVAVNYRTTLDTCSNCMHYTSKKKPPAWMMEGGYSLTQIVQASTDSELRCTLHNFAVKKTAVCNSWEAKPCE